MDTTPASPAEDNPLFKVTPFSYKGESEEFGGYEVRVDTTPASPAPTKTLREVFAEDFPSCPEMDRPARVVRQFSSEPCKCAAPDIDMLGVFCWQCGGKVCPL